MSRSSRQRILDRQPSPLVAVALHVDISRADVNEWRRSGCENILQHVMSIQRGRLLGTCRKEVDVEPSNWRRLLNRCTKYASDLASNDNAVQETKDNV